MIPLQAEAEHITDQGPGSAWKKVLAVTWSDGTGQTFHCQQPSTWDYERQDSREGSPFATCLWCQANSAGGVLQR
jgi:hypothetical protein